ncbi:hypothetical protein O0L34_g12653 [Tuta absoluta]|nr:hypothetical protein O0L34_g12653 [Tuta absoluta]
MKKVRFESPTKRVFRRMDESECHSPRPFVEKRGQPQAPDIYEYRTVTYSSDPVHRHEYSDSSPYPLAKKTTVPTDCVLRPHVYPSNDLNLSMLDVHEPRPQCKSSFKPLDKVFETRETISSQPNVLSPIENIVTPPNVLQKDDSFFIRRDNLDKYNFNINPLQRGLQRPNTDKENNPLSKKAEIVRNATLYMAGLPEKQSPSVDQNVVTSDCNCHHCVKPNIVSQCTGQTVKQPFENLISTRSPITNNMPYPCHSQMISCFHCQPHVPTLHQNCNCKQTAPAIPQNAVDKKTWAIQRFEQNKPECMEVEKQTNIAKEKREPTISDLLKIIKLQNEQLQLLQEKVDKFITASNSQQQIPIQNYMTESVALQTIDSEHKISIGVMTSFEMVRTSTVINKEVLKQNDNAQIQCNRSQISIKEVVSKQPVNLNFLEGISHPPQPNQMKTMESNLCTQMKGTNSRNASTQAKDLHEEKTLNELSLYNVQVDNSTTPQISPEQTLYLDVRDYSDSDSGSSDDQSNVGWTYYNKVMTHVNGLLQDSDMPSSASALYRNTRQQCVQMHIDKTNVSVTKRVKFGDDPYGIHQPHLYAAATDTSLKMNQLAAKYLNSASIPQRVVKPIREPISHVTSNPVEMSVATRNYMEKHNLLQGLPTTSRSPPADEIPRFLDITALKRQTKLL